MRFVLVLFAPALLNAQFTNLTAPGNGADLYYALGAGPGPVYRIGSTPATLFASFPPPVLQPPGATFSNPYYISPYYLASHPQLSRDGSVFAYAAKRICLGGEGCSSVGLYQTTVGSRSFAGISWLSGNGRYLLARNEQIFNTDTPSGVTDLLTGQQQTLPWPFFEDSALEGLAATKTPGRVVADDGTAVCASAGSLFAFRNGQLTWIVKYYTSSAAEPVIDATAQDIVYTSRPLAGPRYLRVYNVASARDSVFVRPNGDTYSPAISADGKRVMFLSTAQWGTSNPPGVTQLYAINLDGTGFQELTSGSEPSGVQEYTMSDDGQVAWYVSGDGNLVKLELASGQTVRRVFHAAAVDLSNTLVPGSAVTLNGSGLITGGVTVNVNSLRAPLLSVSATNITLQVPWEVPPGQVATLRVINHAGAADESSAQATVTPVSSAASLLTCTQPDCWPFQGGAAIHQDWSGFVSYTRPAQPGEVLHFYGMGFGPVQPSVATGAVSPANPPAVVSALPSCTAGPFGVGPVTVLWAGLAPGVVGYYQMDVRLSETTIPPGGLPLYPTTFPIMSIRCDQGIAADFAVGTIPGR